MSSSNCSTVEGSSTNSSMTAAQLAAASAHCTHDEAAGNAEQNDRKRKRNKRGRCSDDRPSEKPRRERANFNAAQLHALERLFHDQKYPDGDLRAKIAQRLDLNEERVQIWFQNRRAKYKRLQREGGALLPDEPSPLSAYDYGQPSSLDYVPPLLDADMLGPGPCVVRGFAQPTPVPRPAAAHASDPTPAPSELQPAPDPTPAASTVKSETSDPHPPDPFPQGLDAQLQLPMDSPFQPDLAMELINWNELDQRSVSSPQSTGGLAPINGMDTPSPSVGKLTGKATLEYQTSINQTRMNVAAAPAVTSSRFSGTLGTTCPTVGSWIGAGLDSDEVLPPPVPLAKVGDSSLMPCPAANQSLPAPVSRVSSTATPTACSRSKFHGGEAPCRHKTDNKCITCREKPPPNRVCTALPAGERNELDEALYRCAVGSIFGIPSFDSPQTPNRANGSVPPPAPHGSGPSTATATGSLDKSPLKPCALTKSAKSSREYSLSAQRRMAMLRKQRRIEAEYLSSSSDSSSDSEGETETRLKRRRKVARRLDKDAPPNQVCTAVPLKDRTLPLPCLTIDSFPDGISAPDGQLLNPPDDFPSCLPSPLSVDRLSSPEPQSSPSEHPECTSSSSSDLSDFEYIPPPRPRPTSPSSSSACVERLNPSGGGLAGRSGTTGVRPPSASPQTLSSGGGLIVPVTATTSPFDAIQYCESQAPYLSGPERNRTPVSSCAYANRTSAHAAGTMHQPPGLLSSIPPPFVTHLNPARVSACANPSDGRFKAGSSCGFSSASNINEKRRSKTCEVLAESAMVGEMCNVASPSYGQVSPAPSQQLFPGPSGQLQHGPRAPPLQSMNPISSTLPVPSAYPSHVADASASFSHAGFTQSNPIPRVDVTSNHYQPPQQLHYHFKENVHHANGQFSPISATREDQTLYAQPLEMRHNFATNGGNGFQEFMPMMRSLGRPQSKINMAPHLQIQNGYGTVGLHGGTNDYYAAPPQAQPPDRLQTTGFAPAWGNSLNQ